MSKLIVVCGLSGSGKTTLARELSRALGVVCVHKDTIKEALYDALQCATLEDSKRVGAAAMQTLLALAQEQCRRGVDVMIEAPMTYAQDDALLRQWEADYGAEVRVIICTIDEDEWQRRLHTRPRHRAHHDMQRTHAPQQRDYATLPGTHITITTDRPVDTLCAEVMAELNLR